MRREFPFCNFQFSLFNNHYCIAKKVLAGSRRLTSNADMAALFW